MVSFSHEFLVELFRARGDLAPALLRRQDAGLVIDHNRVEQRSIDLSQVVPTEYRADAVVVLCDRGNAVVQAVIIEVQLDIDRNKERSWPVYVTALHHKLGCPVVLVVVTPNPKVARWARRPIEIGHPGLRLVPVVVELDNVPRIADPAQARSLPELAMLSALVHRDAEAFAAAQSAISGLPEDRYRLYWDMIQTALPPSLRKAPDMEGPRDEGYYERWKGEIEHLRRQVERELNLKLAVIALMVVSLGEISDEDVAEIEAIRHEEALTALIRVLTRAPGASEIRAAVAAARKGELFDDEE